MNDDLQQWRCFHCGEVFHDKGLRDARAEFATPAPVPPALPTGIMVVCQKCSNKRCPHAHNSEFLCTGSNALGQVGQLASAVPPATEQAPPFDMLAHLRRQREWSERTFGPGERTAGVIDHIRKELREIEDAPADLSEWADVVILGLDGFWRAGATAQQIIDAIVAKQVKNEGRKWPDWRTVPTDKAIEHDRSTDAPAIEERAIGAESERERFIAGLRFVAARKETPLLSINEVRDVYDYTHAALQARPTTEGES